MGKLVVGLLVALLLSAIFALVTALPTMLLWNWIVPSVFGGAAIGYLEAWGLLMLIALLQKGAEVKVTLKE